MNDQLARSLFMDYLYDEISDAEKSKLESYLAKNPELEQELSKLKQTRSLLQQMPEAEPNQQLLMMEPRERTFAQWWQEATNLIPRSGWVKTTLATAACLLVVIFSSSLADLNIQSSEAGFSITFGNQVQPTTAALTSAQTQAIVQQIKRENAAVITEHAKRLNERNQQQLLEVVEYFEQQRANDLQLIDKALNKYREDTETRITQTQQVLGEVVQTVASSNQQ